MTKGYTIEAKKIFSKQLKRFIPGIGYVMTAEDLISLNKCLDESNENNKSCGN